MVSVLLMLLSLVLLFYVYYSFLLFLLTMELFMVGVFFMAIASSTVGFTTFISLMVLICYVVMEAILGLSLLVCSYRFFGMMYFSEW